jgi:hypothetical protein
MDGIPTLASFQLFRRPKQQPRRISQHAMRVSILDIPPLKRWVLPGCFALRCDLKTPIRRGSIFPRTR